MSGDMAGVIGVYAYNLKWLLYLRQSHNEGWQDCLHWNPYNSM